MKTIYTLAVLLVLSSFFTSCTAEELDTQTQSQTVEAAGDVDPVVLPPKKD